jgi:hypothetical protein
LLVKDPYLALGICDALRDAELLANGVDEGLSGRHPLAEALAGYERRRNEATLDEYQQNLQLARLQPPPTEVMQLRAALRGDQEETRRFAMAREGMIPPEEFFNPQNLQRIIAEAQLPQAHLAPLPARPATRSGESAALLAVTSRRT